MKKTYLIAIVVLIVLFLIADLVAGDRDPWYWLIGGVALVALVVLYLRGKRGEASGSAAQIEGSEPEP